MMLNASTALARRTAFVSRPMHSHALVVVVIERLAKLAVAGAPAPRMAAVAGGLVAEWRTGAVPPGILAEQLEVLQTEIEDGLSVAQDYAADADERDKPRTRPQLDVLRITLDTLSSEAERFS